MKIAASYYGDNNPLFKDLLSYSCELTSVLMFLLVKIDRFVMSHPSTIVIIKILGIRDIMQSQMRPHAPEIQNY